MKLTQAVNTAASRPATAQAVVDVNGRMARAHVAANTMSEAVDLPREHLAARLPRPRPYGAGGPRGNGPRIRTWRSGAGHDQRPHRPQLPADERRIVRHLTGLPFAFFNDTATVRGCVLCHRYDGHYGLIAPSR
ncbi:MULTISPECIES: hypothetical protein [unclassified Streptomyces]|uniref:hypothetical protein n=1 Tax=unclassified Streptomyces TaxID=2593676 RepID=UPI00131BBBB2|nr:hypothetical protein [Streptomyces sp. NRRL F-2747]